jgi:uncharacterized protein YuzE
MVSRSIELRYDPEADAAYIYLVPRGPERSVAKTRFCNLEFRGAAINVDLAENDQVVGFELLGASKLLPPDLLSAADEP